MALRVSGVGAQGPGRRGQQGNNTAGSWSRSQCVVGFQRRLVGAAPERHPGGAPAPPCRRAPCVAREWRLSGALPHWRIDARVAIERECTASRCSRRAPCAEGVLPTTWRPCWGRGGGVDACSRCGSVVRRPPSACSRLLAVLTRLVGHAPPERLGARPLREVVASGRTGTQRCPAPLVLIGGRRNDASYRVALPRLLSRWRRGSRSLEA